MAILTTPNLTDAKRRTRTRDLSGGLTTDDIGDTPLDEVIERGDEEMQLITDQTSWTDSDPQIQTAFKYAETCAAIEILDGIPTPDAIAQKDKLESRKIRLANILNKKAEEMGDLASTGIDKTTGDET